MKNEIIKTEADEFVYKKGIKPFFSARIFDVSILVFLIFLPISCEAIDLADLQGWQLVIPKSASETEKFAAEQFQTFLAQSTDVNLPIKKEDCSEKCIFIGYNKLAKLEKLKSAEYGEEGFAILVDVNNIYISGGRPRGTLYGVYTFLENYLGVRFLTADHTYVPKMIKHRQIESSYQTYIPPLLYRHVYSGELIMPQDYSTKLFLTRLRINAPETKLPEKLGLTTEFRLTGHSFGSQLPTKKYGAEHPEYYALYENKRLSNVENDWFETQLCLTNPEVLDHVTNAVEKSIKESPQIRNISVGQNDNYFFCHCDKCRTIDEHEGSPMGSLLTFVNTVADHVKKDHPDIMIGTLAYQYSRKPPLHIKPRSNVQIQLCSIECCIMHPINDTTCPLNTTFCEDMQNWSRICNHVFVWNYNTIFNNYLLPCPDMRVIESNIKYFVSNNVKGIFMQGAYNTVGSEFSDLRNYVTAHLLWDPNQDSQKLIDEFLTLHYGKASAPIKEYITFLHDRACSSGKHAACFGKAQDYGIDDEVVDFGLKAFDKALALAESETIKNRVEKASISVYRAQLEPIWYIAKPKGLTLEQIDKLTPYVRRFLTICSEYGINANDKAELNNIFLQAITKERFGAAEPNAAVSKIIPVVNGYMSQCSELKVLEPFTAASYICEKELKAVQQTLPDKAKYRPLVEHFLNLCAKYNVSRTAEYMTMDEKAQELKEIIY
jgi:hypothetical protein